MSGLRIGLQLMDGLSAGHSPPRRKRKGKEGHQISSSLSPTKSTLKIWGNSDKLFVFEVYNYGHTSILKTECYQSLVKA